MYYTTYIALISLAAILIGARNEITEYLVKITPINSNYGLFLFIVFSISLLVIVAKILTEYVQDTYGPQSTKGLIRYTRCPKGIQVKIKIHDYFFFGEWYTYLDKVYKTEEDAFNDLMYGESIFKIEDSFIVNRILRIRLLHEIEAKEDKKCI